MSSSSALNPDERVPCVDDLCVGILDETGTCGTCGRVGEVRTFRGPIRSRTDADDDAPDAREGDDDEGIDGAEGGTGGADDEADGETDGEGDSATGDDDGDDERIPCDDELCTGIVRANGRCGTCGRVHEPD